MGVSDEAVISLHEANRHFLRYIEAVERGEEIIITRRGRPVARIVKVSHLREPTAAQLRALNLIKSSASAAHWEARTGRVA